MLKIKLFQNKKVDGWAGCVPKGILRRKGVGTRESKICAKTIKVVWWANLKNEGGGVGHGEKQSCANARRSRELPTARNKGAGRGKTLNCAERKKVDGRGNLK